MDFVCIFKEYLFIYHNNIYNHFYFYFWYITLDIIIIAESLGEASNRRAQSRYAFLCVYYILYIIIICVSTIHCNNEFIFLFILREEKWPRIRN